jgi:ABC-type transporter Mla maintaining outer membrane lipid asymmetry ATPase subunit MlaF
MTPDLLRAESLAGTGFSGTSFRIAPGQWLRLADGPRETVAALVDVLFGLAPAVEGEVFWEGAAISTCSESDRLAIAARTAFVHPRGGLLLNLRVWENIVLPLRHHRRQIDTDALEAEILAAFAAAGIDEPAASRILAARTDDLAPHEILLTLLLRAFCMKPALIICEAAFDGLPAHARDTASRLLDHTAACCPGLALLTIGDSPATLANLQPTAWPAPETLTWNPPSWLAT